MITYLKFSKSRFSSLVKALQNAFSRSLWGVYVFITSVKTEMLISSVETEMLITSVKTEMLITSVKTEMLITSVKMELSNSSFFIHHIFKMF